MPQVDNTVFFSIIFSLFKSSLLCYSLLLVYVFYPFIARIKIIFNFFSKIKFTKKVFNA